MTTPEHSYGERSPRGHWLDGFIWGIAWGILLGAITTILERTYG